MAKKSGEVAKKEKDDSERKVEQILVENFVSLQKVMTNLAVKFDNLSGQISKLLELFEISAKTLAEKGYQYSEEKVDKKVIEKLDNVLEQNKIIAKGIALLHENNMGETNQPQMRNMNEPRAYPGIPQRKFPEEKRIQTMDV
jgi:hypothetical protein